MVTIDNKVSSVLNRNLTKSTSDVRSTFLELASGKRINKASDDPASAAIIAQLAQELSTSQAASRNISDGVSAISIADGAATSIGDLNGRLSELAVQSANGTLSDSQRQTLDQEYQSTLSEINRIEGSTSFNGVQLLGSSTNLQTGTSSDSNSQTQLNIPSLNTSSLGLSGQSIATQSGAKAALDASSNAGKTIGSARADLGATESRLNVAYDNLKTAAVNNEAARSSLADVDYAEASARNVAAKITQQAGVALYSIGNTSQANVIQTLLRA